MAVLRRTVAIGVWFFCTCIGEALKPDVTMVSNACRGVQYDMHGNYDRDVRGVIADLVNETQYNAYNYYTQSTESGQVCYGHAACDGRLSHYECFVCLVNANYEISKECPYNIGARVQLKDCRIRYADYQFVE